MDIRMPVLDGLEATRRIAADPTLAHVKILILTTFDIDEHVFEALRVGASGSSPRTPSPTNSSAPSASSPTDSDYCPRTRPTH
jgi:CheY-like chemotaxis protein